MGNDDIVLILGNSAAMGLIFVFNSRIFWKTIRSTCDIGIFLRFLA